MNSSKEVNNNYKNKIVIKYKDCLSQEKKEYEIYIKRAV